MWTGFYNINDLSTLQLREFFKEAKLLSYKAYVDKLDVSKFWAREETDDKTVDDMIDQCSSYYHNVCIDRSVQHKNETYGEIGYTVISERPYYFLCIYVTLDNLKTLINKYKLTKHNM